MNKKQRSFLSLISLLLLITLPLYIKSQYFITIAIFVFVYSILALGLRVMMKMGEVSFAHAAFMGVGAYISALLTMKLQVSFWLTLPIACAATAFLAFFSRFISG